MTTDGTWLGQMFTLRDLSTCIVYCFRNLKVTILLNVNATFAIQSEYKLKQTTM